MTSLIIASLSFLAIHLVVSGTQLRDTVANRLGEGAYMGVFSVLSLVLIAWMSRSYSAALESGQSGFLWAAPTWVVHLGALIMLIAVSMVFIGVTTPSPTSVQAPGMKAMGMDPKGIHRITRHPFLWGGLLWALFHLIVNGDSASLVLFGTFAVLTARGTWSIDAKRARKMGAEWTAYARKTSNIPFAAIAQGRNTLALGEIAWWQWLGALAIYLALAFGHMWLFGVPAHR